ncbi:hypothetical protein [Microbacterium arborescens]|uniref:hypothetical protein n=1 Tax=Microbacterium arborescens TaxID=33883 RepID=UPI002781202B|nr:hypothetical protein [Microbacterium arborescens]MDQ1215823.1 hypothetical protein [Microbacterium arborescens]
MSDVSAGSARTHGSKETGDDSAVARSYRGGDSDRTAFNTVVREIPNRSVHVVELRTALMDEIRRIAAARRGVHALEPGGGASR